MSGKNSIQDLSEPKKAELLDIFILMSMQNFMLNSVEHEKSFTTSGPVQQKPGGHRYKITDADN